VIQKLWANLSGYWYSKAGYLARYVSRSKKSNTTMYGEIKVLAKRMLPLIFIPSIPPNLYERTLVGVYFRWSMPPIDCSMMVASRTPMKSVLPYLRCCICKMVSYR
jgi:hypothetical protein